MTNSKSSSKPPIAKRLAATASYHGTTLTDHYGWLKDPDYPAVNDAEVLDYLKAENEYFNQAMAPLKPLVDELFEEIKARQAPEDESVPYAKNGWRYQWRFAKDAQYRAWYRAPVTDPENWHSLLDETVLAQAHEYFRLGSLSVSPSATRMAYSTDTNGSERFALNIIDIETGESLSPRINNVSGSPVWGDDDQLYYVRLSDEWRPYQVWHHKLGNDQDRLVYEESDSSFFVGIDLAQSEQYVLISAGGHTHNEVSFVPRADLNAAPQIISPRRDLHEYDVDHGDGQFFIRSNREHTNFNIYAVDEAAYEEQNWQINVAGSSSIYITGHVKFKDRLIVMERHQGLDQVRIVNGQGSYLLPFEEPSYDVGLGANPNYETDTLRLSYTSMVTPNTVFDYNLVDQTRTVKKVQTIPSGYDATQFVTQRVEVTARDGISVPVSLVHHRDTPLDGSAPLYLYGYGAYGMSIPPSFSTTRISLLERGFVYAIAHIRGGDDLGYDWYTQGKLKHRTNTFNDFVDVAQHMVKANYTRAGNIAIAGGSAGGELMGAVLNQAPELWGAVAAHVPFVDVLNTMLDESLPLTPLEWPEWGDPIRDAEAFTLIQSYSPYDQLKEGNYPPIMVTAGLNDPRVTYWEPAKFVAKLRHLKKDNSLLILKTNMGAGHGGKSGRFDSLRESAEEYAFFLKALNSSNL